MRGFRDTKSKRLLVSSSAVHAPAINQITTIHNSYEQMECVPIHA